MLWKIQEWKNQIKWQIKWAYQRVVHGHDERALWSLHVYIDPIIVAHLEYQLKHGSGYPLELTNKKWKKILKAMHKGFRPAPTALEEVKKYSKWKKDRALALVLFSIYYDWLCN